MWLLQFIIDDCGCAAERMNQSADTVRIPDHLIRTRLVEQPISDIISLVPLMSLFTEGNELS